VQLSQPANNSVQLPEDAALRKIAEGIKSETGEGFFSSLVRHLALVLNCQYAFVSELSKDRLSFRTRAVWGRGQFLQNFDFPLAGTPCEAVLNGHTAHYPEKLCQLFPEDKGLADWAAESYCGVPLVDLSDRVVGHLAIIDDKPMPDGPRGLAIMRILAARAYAEIERLRAEVAIREGEERLASILGSAMDAIITFDASRTIELFNHAAEKIFRCSAYQAIGQTLDPFLTDAFRKVIDESIRRSGSDASGAFVWAPGGLHAKRAGGEEFRAEATISQAGVRGRRLYTLILRDIDERGRAEHALRQQLRKANEALEQSEEHFHDLFDEAPIAYVHEGLDSRFIEANRAAMRILGIKPEEIAGLFGKSLVPDTPDAQGRLREALDSIGRGTDTNGVVLELRRKDNGKPVWVQWWSRPAASGSYTRTMFVDITDRMLMEQEQVRLEAQNAYLLEEIRSGHNFGNIVGHSRALEEVLDKVRLVAGTDSSVLVLGETGTGKELIARAIHSSSPRKAQPLIKVNCSALPTGLIESELFGHEKGAFTGATEKRIGRFELANGGTIFLDEIGEVSAEVQLKLLRVLQEREFERLGGRETIKVDVRVIAATNRDLRRAVFEGALREDLYYRLSVFPLRVPPLRERSEDIPLLVHYFVGRHATRIGRRISRVPKAAMERLVAYPWPGNVRELENVIERAVILSPGLDLEVAAEGLLAPLERAHGSDQPPQAHELRQVRVSGGAPIDSTQTLEEIDRTHIVEVLQRTGWKIDGTGGAARLLKLHPSTLRSRIKRLGIRRSASNIS
jgi:formate hydrogenlyase transcriptional activator